MLFFRNRSKSLETPLAASIGGSGSQVVIICVYPVGIDGESIDINVQQPAFEVSFTTIM